MEETKIATEGLLILPDHLIMVGVDTENLITADLIDLHPIMRNPSDHTENLIAHQGHTKSHIVHKDLMIITKNHNVHIGPPRDHIVIHTESHTENHPLLTVTLNHTMHNLLSIVHHLLIITLEVHIILIALYVAEQQI